MTAPRFELTSQQRQKVSRLPTEPPGRPVYILPLFASSLPQAVHFPFCGECRGISFKSENTSYNLFFVWIYSFIPADWAQTMPPTTTAVYAVASPIHSWSEGREQNLMHEDNVTMMDISLCYLYYCSVRGWLQFSDASINPRTKRSSFLETYLY